VLKYIIVRTKNAIAVVMILLMQAFGPPCSARQTGPLPVFYPVKPAGPNAFEMKKARKLYELAKKENPKLQWDNCLAGLAFMRARRMVNRHYFGHEDLQTGKIRLWSAMSSCIPAGSARLKTPEAENLECPMHRENILNRRFNHVGIGCCGNVCSELFAGF
jgi:Cysteine-rich secretory protein family